jgi:predicted HicB family RNase H-like nuclease
MPSTLHAQLATRAEQQGVSLNQLIVVLLAGGIGFKLKK